MAEELDPRAQELLAQVAAGDLAADAPEVAAAVAHDPGLGVALAELLAAQARLDAAGLVERQVEAARRAPVPDVRADLVAETITRLAAGAAPGRGGGEVRRRHVLWFAVAAAAAAVVLAWWLARDGEQGPAPDDQRRLGPARLQLEAPAGDLHTGLTLSWRAVRGLRFVAMVYDPQAQDAPVLVREESTDTTWELSAEQLQRVRPGFRWRVVAMRPDGVEVERKDAPL